MTPTAPLDSTHEDALSIVSWIRGTVVELKLAAAKWEPRPMPEDWR